MAYKIQEQKLLPGGLNLLAPGDAITDGDSLDLTKFWPGAAGRLEQARDLLLISSPFIIAAQDSLLETDGRVYYGGSAAGELRQIGRASEAAIDTGYDSAPLGMLGYQGYAWIMNRAKQRKDDGATVTDWTPAAPGAPTLEDGGVDGTTLTPISNNPPEVGGLAAQEYLYYITWVGPLGESNPSPSDNITPAVDGSIVRIHQSSPPAWVTGWNIYRRSPTFSAPYRLNEFTLDISRTYVDDYGDDVHTHSDEQLLTLGILMEADHDAAPAARVIANSVYNERILVANSATHKNRIWYTQPRQPAFFRGAANPNDGDWVDVGTDSGDEILYMSVRPRMVVIYRSKSIWRHIGDMGEPGAVIEPVVPDIGIVGVHGVASTSLGDYFLGVEKAGAFGVYRFNGDWAECLSQKITPALRGLTTENFPQYSSTYRALVAIGHSSGRVWVTYPFSNGNPAGSFIYHIESKRWFFDSIGGNCFLDTGSRLLAAGFGVYSLESTYTTNQLRYQSQYQDCGLPDHEKTFADLVINHNTQGQAVTVDIRTNNGADQFTLAAFGSVSLNKTVIPLVYPPAYFIASLRGEPIRAYNLAVRLTCNGSNSGAPVIIDTPILLHYYTEARRGRSFDTDETDHGMQDTKQVDQVELDVDSPFGIPSLKVLSDIPGGIMADRSSGGAAISSTTGRQMRRVVLTTPAVGRLLRYTVTGNSEFYIYGARARLLPIGVYLDGSAGDFWQPQAVSIGV